MTRCRVCRTESPLGCPSRFRSESGVFFERLAADVRSGSVSPVYALFASIAGAEHFVHYVVEGMGSGVVAILRDAVSRRVAVRGVAGASISCTPVRPVEGELLGGMGLIVVDGKIAFKGPGVVSSNIWARAAVIEGLLEVASDSLVVTLWNNRLFAPLWMEQSVAFGNS